MYENLTYDQLKGMQDAEKTEALKELLQLYPDSKSIANKLGVVPVVITNLVRRLIENKPVGRVKGSKNTQKVIDVQPEATKTQELVVSEVTKPKRTYTRKIKEPENTQADKQLVNVVSQPVIEVKKQGIKASNMIEGRIIGSELIKRLEGLSKAIMDNVEYNIVIKTEEI